MDAEVRQATSRYVEHQEWFNDAEGRKSDKKEMREVISDWEGQHGPLTPQEKAEARSVLGQRASTAGLAVSRIRSFRRR